MEWIDEADGVFRGGGVKGIALAGALEGFAEHPIKPVRRWVDVAGASAGAIIASYLAVGHSAREMVDLLEAIPFASFRDPRHGRLLAPIDLLVHHGLARGRAFERWFHGVLEGATFARVRRPPAPGAGGRPASGWRLKLIAADVTNRRLLVLPDDLPRYREPGASAPIDPDAFPISRAVRMSMSIPFFFEPVELRDAETGRVATIVDGGTLSNFPVWLWDVDPQTAGRAPVRPTFGFTLTGGRGLGTGGALARLAPWPVRFAADIFRTTQEAWDARFVSHSTRVRTVTVDADGVATTELDLSPQRRELLLGNGRQAAQRFLDAFDLDSYMNTFHAGIAARPTRP